MSILPIFEIFFALALALSPANCEKFTVSTEEFREPITWTLEADGWHARSATQRDLGVFTIDGNSVSIKRDGKTTSESVEGSFRVDTQNDITKVQFQGEAVSFAREGNKVILRSLRNKELPPIVIEYQQRYLRSR